MNKQKKTLGVVVGRFQVPELHSGHRHLIETAIRESDGVLVVLGSTGGFPDGRNPLPYAVREQMILGVFPRLQIAELVDTATNEDWSEWLDALVRGYAGSRTAVLYASRDGFADAYCGKYAVKVIPPLRGAPSGTEVRGALPGAIDSIEFRAGMIAAQRARLPVSYQTVDIAVVRYETGEVLVGQKAKDGDQVRLIGGFVDPKDASLKGAALRELREEAGSTLLTHEVRYLGSYRIADTRYRGSEDGVMTTLFVTYLMGGAICAGDDMDRVMWIPIQDLVSRVVPQHQKLAERVIEFTTSSGK